MSKICTHSLNPVVGDSARAAHDKDGRVKNSGHVLFNAFKKILGKNANAVALLSILSLKSTLGESQGGRDVISIKPEIHCRFCDM